MDKDGADGTFDYPEPIIDLDAHVRFWETVPVPDQVLAEVADAYIVGRDRWAGEQMDAFDAAYDQHYPDAEPQQINSDRQSEWERLQAAYASELNPASVRTVARAYKMAVYARINLDDNRVQRVLDHEMPWPDREQPTRTVNEILQAVGPAWPELGVILDPQQAELDDNDNRHEILGQRDVPDEVVAGIQQLRAENQLMLEELGNINNTTHDSTAAVQAVVERLARTLRRFVPDQ